MDVVVYECDRKQCEYCIEGCHMTSDIRHAKNFIFDDLTDAWWEKNSDDDKMSVRKGHEVRI